MMVGANDPFAFAGMAVDVSRFLAMFTPAPQGLMLLGRRTSRRTGVPLTPRAGETAAWALTAAANARKKKAAMKDFENMLAVLRSGKKVIRTCRRKQK